MPTYTINGKRVKTETALTDDQIDEIAADLGAAPAAALQSPKLPERSWLGAVGEAVSNIPSSAGRMISGLYEAVSSPLDTAKSLTQAVGGAYANAADYVSGTPGLGQYIFQMYGFSPEQTKNAVNVANQFGGVYKDRYGSEEAIKRTLATDPVGFSADISMLLGGGAGAARVAGAPVKVTNALRTGAQVTNPFAVLSTPVVTKPVTAAARLVGKPVAGLMIGPKANTLLEAAGDKGQAIINALRGNTEIVPGSMPTAGEAAAGVGATRYSALQKAAMEGDAVNAEYFARMQQQEAARLAAIRGVGKTEADLEAAKAARSGTASQTYGAAERQIVQADPEITALMETPSMRAALARAKKIAADKQDVFDIGQTAPAGTKTVPANVPGWPNAVRTVQTPATFAEYPVKSLHYIKMALDDMIRDPETFGIGRAEAGATTGVREKFLTWLEDKAPDYATARKTFATQSGPINQMEVGQYLESKLTGALDETGRQRATVFGGAVKNAPQTIKQATTGGTKFEKLSQVLTPDQLRVIDEVRRDLTRQGLFEREAAFASKAGPNAADAATRLSRELAGGTQIPSILSRTVTVANAILKRLGGKIDRKIAIEIATEMLDPQKAAAAMEAALAKQAKVAKLKSGVRQVGGALKSQAAKDVARAAAISGNALSSNNNALAEP